jgi:SanA protein
MKKICKILFRFTLIIILFSVLFILFAEWRISRATKKLLFDSYDQLPDSSVVLVLGTSQRLSNGNPNLFFTYRMNAVKELYDHGKARVIVVSGDNRRRHTNEPRDMRNALLALNIPDSIIHPDYAGFRTLDSVIRMKKVFGQSKFIIVSQKFHNERAVYIAGKNNIKVVGYNAKNVSMRYGFKTFVRERLARVKVFIDILIKKEPHFLGEPINIH